MHLGCRRLSKNVAQPPSAVLSSERHLVLVRVTQPRAAVPQCLEDLFTSLDRPDH